MSGDPHEIREAERLKYLAVNADLPDANERWHVYENLILDKYGTTGHALIRRAERLDAAWTARDKEHERIRQNEEQ